MAERERLVLLDRSCRKREFDVPEGYMMKTRGAAARGDRWWRWSDESWQPVVRNAFLGSPVDVLQAVITPVMEPNVS